MKNLIYYIVLFKYMLSIGCKEEEITNWDSIVPGHYIGKISISTDLESRLAPSGQQTLYSYKTNYSFATTADITYNGYAFTLSFEENEIIGKEVISVYNISSDNRKAGLGLSRSPGISKPKTIFSGMCCSGDAIYFQNNELSINVSYLSSQD